MANSDFEIKKDLLERKGFIFSKDSEVAEMLDGDSVHELAVLNGIEHTASDHVKRQLLDGMRIPANTDEEVQDSLEETLNAPFKKALPSFQVLREKGNARQGRLEFVVEAGKFSDRDSLSFSAKSEKGEAVEKSVRLGETQPLYSRTINGVRYERRAMDLDKDFTPSRYGYHSLSMTLPDGHTEESRIAYAPQKCYNRLKDGQKTSGLSVQLYAMRSDDDQGIGDYTTLGKIMDISARSGMGVVGVNPLSTLTMEDPEFASVYMPYSRTGLNPLYIDITAMPEMKKSEEAYRKDPESEKASLYRAYQAPEFQEDLKKARRARYIDYTRVSRLKMKMFKGAYADFRAEHLGANGGEKSKRGQAFEAFCKMRGEPLDRWARAVALENHFSKDAPPGESRNWWQWPEEYKDLDGLAARKFAADNPETIDFYKYLEFEGRRQLKGARDIARDTDMPIGLYGDMPVGISWDGPDLCGVPETYMKGASAGAAPDPSMSIYLQDWGNAGLNPKGLEKQDYDPYIDMVRSSMEEYDMLRFDHGVVMQRLCFVPWNQEKEGMENKDGAHVYYNVDDIMALTALESHRNKSMVILEDIALIPDHFPERMEDYGMLGFDVVDRERHKDGSFKDPAGYRENAASSASTHDIETLSTLWRGSYVHQRRAAGYYRSEEDYQADLKEVKKDRIRINKLLTRTGAWKAVGGAPVKNPGDMENNEIPDKLEEAFAWALSRAPSQVVLLQPEDVLRRDAMVNIPGTAEKSASSHPDALTKEAMELEKKERGEGGPEYPKEKNWRHREEWPVETWRRHPIFNNVARILSRARPYTEDQKKAVQNHKYEPPGLPVSEKEQARRDHAVDRRLHLYFRLVPELKKQAPGWKKVMEAKYSDKKVAERKKAHEKMLKEKYGARARKYLDKGR